MENVTVTLPLKEYNQLINDKEKYHQLWNDELMDNMHLRMQVIHLEEEKTQAKTTNKSKKTS